MKKTFLFILIILLISIPSFSLMLKFGIFSMQDFHFFRLVEFDRCIQNLQIPCRWVADSGAGYGEPLFNFYGQFAYFVGEAFHFFGLTKIDSLKLLFIFSFIGSAISMFFLSRKIWKDDFSALVSSILYLYAPYRAVDVWVRGALPEAFSFVVFPIIIISLENYLEKKKIKDLLFFSLSFAILVISHNLSVILFAPFFIIWILFRFLQIKKIKPFLNLLFAGIFSFLLSAFYILPVIFESKFININSTTLGVYDWRANFVTIYQLFVSRFWGYGGSTWGPNDGLSLSVGHMQWIIPLVVAAVLVLKRKLNKDTLTFLVLIVIGIFALFLTHNKSTFLWDFLPFMKYIQFPWRFLSLAVFALSLSSGLLVKVLGKFKWIVLVLVLFITILINFNFFRPDIWIKASDNDLETGSRWTESTFSSLPDYWPNYGPLPSHTAPIETGDVKLLEKESNKQVFNVKTFGKTIEFPISYFPGWELNYEGQNINIYPDKDGLIGAVIPEGKDIRAVLNFKNTQIRMIGNIISLVSIAGWLTLLCLYHNR